MPMTVSALDPETSDSFEVGLKTTTFKERLAVNMSRPSIPPTTTFKPNFTDVVLGGPGYPLDQRRFGYQDPRGGS